MRIDSSDTLVGQPVLKVREMLRKCQGGIANPATVEVMLGVDSATATQVIGQLSKLGYIELYPGKEDRLHWQNTLLGNALALATAAKPITRRTAEKTLREFLLRVEQVRDDPQYLAKVTKAILFGSYLTDKERINDVDVAINLAWKDPEFGGREFMEVVNEQVEAARAQGRSFRTHEDVVSWPFRKVLLFLKARSHSLSLHYDNDGILQQCDSKVVYEETAWRRPNRTETCSKPDSEIP